MGLLIRGLIGANPPTVKLVTSLGWKNTHTHTLEDGPKTAKTEKRKAATAAKSFEMKKYWNTWYYSIVPINVSVQAANEMLTLDPPANTRCLVLHTNMPPFSTSFLQCRKAKPLNKCRISPSRPYSRNTNTHTDRWTVLHARTEKTWWCHVNILTLSTSLAAACGDGDILLTFVQIILTFKL